MISVISSSVYYSSLSRIQEDSFLITTEPAKCNGPMAQHRKCRLVTWRLLLCSVLLPLLSHLVVSNSLRPIKPLYPWNGIFQARILDRVAISYSRGSSQLRNRIRIFCVSCITGGFFTCQVISEVIYALWFLLKNKIQDFSSGPVVKNLPANAGDTDWIPDPGRFHMLWGT